ncbi:MAG: protein phosphatase 2C domain-containing protein [Pseudomonadota bacterium]
MPRDDALVLGGSSQVDRVETAIAGGTALAFSAPSPDRERANEDTVALIPYGPQAAIFVVADGAGGMPGGGQASQLAVRTLIESLAAASEKTLLLRTAILDGIEAANSAVLNLGNGSATTFTVVTLDGRVARAYQVGDSEAFVLGQKGRIRLQTPVHSPTGFAVEAGFLNEREALQHADRHLVSNFIGNVDMRIDIGAEVTLQSHDTVVLASDGLMDNVLVSEMVERARKGPITKAADAALGLAQHRMGTPTSNQPSKPDDLSLILFRKPIAHRGK